MVCLAPTGSRPISFAATNLRNGTPEPGIRSLARMENRQPSQKDATREHLIHAICDAERSWRYSVATLAVNRRRNVALCETAPRGESTK